MRGSWKKTCLPSAFRRDAQERRRSRRFLTSSTKRYGDADCLLLPPPLPFSRTGVVAIISKALRETGCNDWDPTKMELGPWGTSWMPPHAVQSHLFPALENSSFLTRVKTSGQWLPASEPWMIFCAFVFNWTKTVQATKVCFLIDRERTTNRSRAA